MEKKYRKVTVGGTFDRLHIGHEKMIESAFELGGEVVVGLTSDEFVKSKALSELILPYSERYREIEEFIGEKGWRNNWRVMKLDDIYGTTLSDKKIEAMVVSTETKTGAEKVNSARTELGMTPLPIEVVELVVDELGEKISSEHIRRGKISREGIDWLKPLREGVVLREDQKLRLKQPMGGLWLNGQIDGELNNFVRGKLGIVGDRSLIEFSQRGFKYDWAVFDGKIERKECDQTAPFVSGALVANNSPGSIEAGATEAIVRLVEGEGRYLKIEGEEDLMVLPLILSMPLGSLVVYGQPGEGLVAVEVSEESKKRWYDFLKS